MFFPMQPLMVFTPPMGGVDPTPPLLISNKCVTTSLASAAIATHTQTSKKPYLLETVGTTSLLGVMMAISSFGRREVVVSFGH